MAVTIKLCLMERVRGGEGGGEEGRRAGERGLKKDGHSERHISSRLRRSDSVKHVCRKSEQKGKRPGESQGGGGGVTKGREDKLFTFSDISDCCSASEGKLINCF